MQEIIAVERVRKSHQGTVALDGVSLAFEGPQVVAILGPNGAGKTSLLDLLEGLSTPDSGEIRLFGAPIRRNNYPKLRVGVVMQREFIPDGITVAEYAELFAAIYRVADGGARILEAARLQERRRVAVDRLSGGEAQRLIISAASVHRPELLFLDEPTSALDPAGKAEIGRFLRHMAEHRTVILATHDLREADAIADYVLFLVGGRVRAAGPKAELIAQVPESERHGRGIEDAFFHFCTARINAQGELE